MPVPGPRDSVRKGVGDPVPTRYPTRAFDRDLGEPVEYDREYDSEYEEDRQQQFPRIRMSESWLAPKSSGLGKSPRSASELRNSRIGKPEETRRGNVLAVRTAMKPPNCRR